MRVQTIQGYDLGTFDDSIELGRGRYKNDRNIIRAKRKLYDLLEEDQLVWCSQGELYLSDKEVGRFFHEIDVDFRDDVYIINSFVWCRIIGYDSGNIPLEDLDELKLKVSSSGDFDTAFQDVKDKYIAENTPADLWTAVRKPEITKNSDQLVVKFPFVFSKIVNVEPITKEMVKKKLSTTNTW